VTAPQDPFSSPGRDGTPNDPFGAPPPGPGQGPGYGQAPGPGQAAGYGQAADAGQAPGQPPYGAPAYGQPAYGSPPYGSAAGRPHRNGLGIAALVLGILAVLSGFLFIGGLFGLAAIVCGVLGRGRAKRGEATNGGMALAGIVLGVVGLLFAVLAAVGVYRLVGTEEFGNLRECLDSAGSDRAAQQECQRDFQSEVETGTGGS